MAISKDELLNRIEGRVEIKNVDISKSLSEETLAFSATVYVDGERAATAKNRGRGGMTDISRYADRRGGSITYKDKIDELREIASELPEIQTMYGNMEYSAEMLIDFLANHEDLMRTIKRHMRNDKIVFRTPDQEYGEFSYIGYNGSETGAADMVYDRYDVDVMYNDIDTDALSNA